MNKMSKLHLLWNYLRVWVSDADIISYTNPLSYVILPFSAIPADLAICTNNLWYSFLYRIYSVAPAYAAALLNSETYALISQSSHLFLFPVSRAKAQYTFQAHPKSLPLCFHRSTAPEPITVSHDRESLLFSFDSQPFNYTLTHII
jgi:hypothetical protein